MAVSSKPHHQYHGVIIARIIRGQIHIVAIRVGQKLSIMEQLTNGQIDLPESESAELA